MATRGPGHACGTCGADDWKWRQAQRTWACRPCSSATVKAWRQGVRLEAVEHYGGRCACPGCDVTEPVFLAFDHKDGGGNQHRKAERITGGNGMAVWLKRHGWPEEYQLLCHNCNYAKHALGRCPHEG